MEAYDHALYDHACPFDNRSLDAKLCKDSSQARSKTVCPFPIEKLISAQLNVRCDLVSSRGVCKRHSDPFRRHLSKAEQRAYFSHVATATDSTMLSVQGLLNTKVYSLMTAEHIANTLKNVQTIVDGVNDATQVTTPEIARNTATIEELFATTRLATEKATEAYTVQPYMLPAPPSPVTPPSVSLNPNLELLEELADCQSALDLLTEKYNELVSEKNTADLLIKTLRANLD